MRKALALATALLALAVAPAALAHPLGNFTTNSYTELVASGERLYVLSIVDLAEIPTFQANEEVSRLGRGAYADRLASRVRSGLSVRVDGRTRGLERVDRKLTFPMGAAGLRTTRLEVLFDAGRAPTGRHDVNLRAEAFAGRIGWREIVVRAERGSRLPASTVASQSISDRLRAYPKDLLQSPLSETAAGLTLEASSDPGIAPRLGDGGEGADARAPDGGFASLVAERELSVGFVLVALVLALFWGAAHALTPGHGKAIVAAYLVGTKGRPRDALALGGIVTITHTIGVFALGVVTLLLSELIVPEDLYPWLNLVSALLVVVVGVTVLRQRVLGARGAGHSHDHHHHHHHHHHGDHHHHGHEHGHSHAPPSGSGWRGLVAVGVSGGILPCPTALVVLLAAISLHRVAFGLVLIVAFSIGLAAVISGIGLLAIGARQTFRRMSFEGPVVRALPAVSALAVFGIGIAMTVRALPGVV